MKKFLIIPIVMLFLLVPLAHAQSDVPFNWALPSNNGGCSNENWALINGAYAKNNGFDFVNGVNDSDFTGRTLTQITIYLCRGSTTNTNSTIIGVFSNALNPTTKASFGTKVQSSLTTSYVAYSFTGSYVMQAHDIIGIEYYGNTPAGNTCNVSANCAWVALSCSPDISCATSVLSNGGVVDTQTGRATPQFYSAGSTVSMTLCFNGVCPSGACGSLQNTLGTNVNCQLTLGATMFSPVLITFFGMMTVVMIAGVVNGGKQGMRVTDYMKQNAPFLIFMGIIFLIWASVAKVIP